jgi:hypothetical protein
LVSPTERSRRSQKPSATRRCASLAVRAPTTTDVLVRAQTPSLTPCQRCGRRSARSRRRSPVAHLGVRPMDVRKPNICFGSPAERAPASPSLVAGRRAVFVLSERLRAERVSIEIEPAAVGPAIGVGRSRRRLATFNCALVVPRHRRTGRLHDLANTLTCQADGHADAR